MSYLVLWKWDMQDLTLKPVVIALSSWQLEKQKISEKYQLPSPLKFWRLLIMFAGSLIMALWDERFIYLTRLVEFLLIPLVALLVVTLLKIKRSLFIIIVTHLLRSHVCLPLKFLCGFFPLLIRHVPFSPSCPFHFLSK